MCQVKNFQHFFLRNINIFIKQVVAYYIQILYIQIYKVEK